MPNTFDVKNPYTGQVVARYPLTDQREIAKAIQATHDSFAAMRAVPSWQRADLLHAIRDGVVARRDDFAHMIAVEAGKPIADSRAETDRAILTLTLSAEEAKRIGGELLPLDLNAASAGRFGITRRFPVGPIAAITPFNFPLNLGMHKVGPALAAGNTVVWKPSLLAPGPACLISEIFRECAEKHGVPLDALNVVTPPDQIAAGLVSDPRIRMISFTGSARVGWDLRAKAGTKKVVLELGGNAAVIIAADCDLDHAVGRCVAGGFGYAGQTCISVQRILIERTIYETFTERLVALATEIKVGDPLDESVRMGPMISEKEASRLESWIGEAVDSGARLLTGGKRDGLLWQPTVVADVPPEAKLWAEEAFGPVVVVAPYDRLDTAIDRVNDTRYGLQAGIFTRDSGAIFRAFERIEVGGVIANDVPTYRIDSMPYGGVKDSGSGREGVRCAIEDMTELRLLVIAP